VIRTGLRKSGSGAGPPRRVRPPLCAIIGWRSAANDGEPTQDGAPVEGSSVRGSVLAQRRVHKRLSNGQ